VGGVRIADPGEIRAIVTAVERSRGGAEGEILGEVLRGIAGTGGRDVRPGAGPSGGKLPRTTVPSPPRLSQSAAAAVYDIIRTLHTQLPAIAEPIPPSAPIPAEEFLSDDVELRGLLDETLARGRGAYGRVLSASTASLRALAATNGVGTVRPPTARIEVVADGGIRVTLAVSLRIEAPSLRPSGRRTGLDLDGGCWWRVVCRWIWRWFLSTGSIKVGKLWSIG